MCSRSKKIILKFEPLALTKCCMWLVSCCLNSRSVQHHRSHCMPVLPVEYFPLFAFITGSKQRDRDPGCSESDRYQNRRGARGLHGGDWDPCLLWPSLHSQTAGCFLLWEQTMGEWLFSWGVWLLLLYCSQTHTYTDIDLCRRSRSESTLHSRLARRVTLCCWLRSVCTHNKLDLAVFFSHTSRLLKYGIMFILGFKNI